MPRNANDLSISFVNCTTESCHGAICHDGLPRSLLYRYIKSFFSLRRLTEMKIGSRNLSRWPPREPIPTKPWRVHAYSRECVEQRSTSERTFRSASFRCERGKKVVRLTLSGLAVSERSTFSQSFLTRENSSLWNRREWRLIVTISDLRR